MAYLSGVETSKLREVAKNQKYDLQKLRKSLNMSQATAAGSVGFSVRKWQRIEKAASLSEVVEFVLANAGKFVLPENPFDIFRIEGQLFSLKDIKS